MKHTALFALPILVAACSPAPADPEEERPAQAKTESGTVPEAGPSPATPDRALATTMPADLRGDWHKDDLGRAPTDDDCDTRLRGTVDWDRLMNVRDDGYGYFETGGRIMTVHNRTNSMIDATFDTTYADTPTSERRDFALQDDGTLAVNADDGDGVMKVTQYRRCPE